MKEVIIITNNMIEDKAKELNLKIKLNIIYKYSIIYIQIIRGSKSNRKKFKEWIEENRPLRIKIIIKESNLFKEAAKTITSTEANEIAVKLFVIVSLLTRNYVASIVGITFLIPLAIQDVAKAIRQGKRLTVEPRAVESDMEGLR